MVDRDLALVERYSGLRQRLHEMWVRRFHPNLAAYTRLDDLEGALDRLAVVLDEGVRGHELSLRADEGEVVKPVVEDDPPPPPAVNRGSFPKRRARAADADE